MKKVLKRTLVVAAALYLFIIIAGPAAMLWLFTDKHVNYNRVYDAAEAGLPAPDTLWLRTADGLRIHTLEVKPEGEVKGAVICLSGIENPSVTAFYGHSKEFRELGLTTLMPDVRGHGESDGGRIYLAYEETADVKAITEYLKATYADIPVIVMGLSMGGAIAVRSIGENDDIDALVSISAYSSIQDFMWWQFGRFITPVLAYPVKLTTGLYASFMFGCNAFKATPLNAIGNLDGRPALMMQSRGDTQVPYLCFERLTEKAATVTDNLSTYVVDGDEHFVSNSFGIPEDDKNYNSALLGFIKAVIGDGQPESDSGSLFRQDVK